ncbi:MAG: toll/interleukin-1 receptor domain-containing protein [bacterium]|nr:toll/interleukin-1 receptor domain-containing protein [bacterium]
MRLYLSYDPADRDQAQAFGRKLTQADSQVILVERPEALPGETPPTDEIKAAIEASLAQASVAVCVVSEATKDNVWVNFEMAAAEMEGRGIVGFFIEDLYLGPLEWPEFFRLRHTQYEVMSQGPTPKILKAIQRAERKGTQTNLFGM